MGQPMRSHLQMRSSQTLGLRHESSSHTSGGSRRMTRRLPSSLSTSMLKHCSQKNPLPYTRSRSETEGCGTSTLHLNLRTTACRVACAEGTFVYLHHNNLVSQ